jgi:excisionase family DNA binding protein
VTSARGREYRPGGAEASPPSTRAATTERPQASRSLPTTSTPAPLTIEAAAERLGVTPRLVRRLVTERRIGFVRVGKFIRLRQEDLDAYLDEHFEPPLARRRTR